MRKMAVLKYAEGINCQYKKRITVGKEKIELPDCFQGNFKVNIWQWSSQTQDWSE